MNALKRPLCWITRHHWLLHHELPFTMYAHNEQTAESKYFYQCQVCGDWNTSTVVNLDNADKEYGEA